MENIGVYGNGGSVFSYVTERGTLTQPDLLLWFSQKLPLDKLHPFYAAQSVCNEASLLSELYFL